MKIAPGGITENDWRMLDLSTQRSADWAKAITIFRQRIRERFIEPVDKMIENEQCLPRTQRKYGFAVLAIDCLLIETLQAFRYGKVNTEGESRSLITNFLQKCPHFCWSREVSNQFFDDFRCGILHQAETMRDSLVRSEGALLIQEPTGLIINRTEFHERLKTAFADYVRNLQQGRPPSLRDKFRSKMDHICRDNELARKYPVESGS
jgi:hypothetical protein